MVLVAMLAVVGSIVAAGTGLLLVVCVGLDRLHCPFDDPDVFWARLVDVGPYVLGLGVVLVANKGLQPVIYDLSTRVGYRATGSIYRLEGDVVATFQGMVPDGLMLYFAIAYVFGYAILLSFPIVSYLFSTTAVALKRLLAAYAINYAVAIACYTLVYAYGPRNHSPERVDAVLLELVPQITQLTAQVNRESNVFPSLHVSLSVTVLAMAATTREEFSRWLPIAALLAASVVLSTMALGIHWLTDVVAGIALGAASVVVATRVIGRRE